MVRKQLRALLTLTLMLGMLIPASLAAQNATPEASPMASPVVSTGLQAGVDWLIGQQQEDGSWLGFSGEPDAGTTVDAVIALGAARASGVDTGDAIEKAIAWLDADEVGLVYAQTGTGQSAKLVLALVAGEAESLEISGIMPLEFVKQGQADETGLYGTGLYDHAYALMALAATGEDVPANAISFLETVQAESGGFSFDGSTDETMVDSNTTAMIVQALVATGNGESDVVAKAIGYLKTTITDGGAGYNVGAEADANSTALVAQALLAVDQDATHLITSLDTFQNPNGAYFWMNADPADNLFSTIQVIPAAAQQTLPVVPGLDALDEAA